MEISALLEFPYMQFIVSFVHNRAGFKTAGAPGQDAYNYGDDMWSLSAVGEVAVGGGGGVAKVHWCGGGGSEPPSSGGPFWRAGDSDAPFAGPFWWARGGGGGGSDAPFAQSALP